ncbi:MAG: hypothetical protein GY754_04190 [bacterium]|nr:hypothetical protein [bacterium]
MEQKKKHLSPFSGKTGLHSGRKWNSSARMTGKLPEQGRLCPAQNAEIDESVIFDSYNKIKYALRL